MVTRRTRVLSAIAAVLMLVSMFTCFYLPATAATPTSYAELPEGPMPWPDVDLVPFARHKTSAYSSATVTDGDGITHYAITDADDWLAAVSYSNNAKYTFLDGSESLAKPGARQTYENTIFWITNDIDFSAFDGTRTVADSNDTEGWYSLFLCDRGNNSTTGGFRGSLYGQGYAFKNLKIDLTYAVSNGNYDNLGIIGTGNGCTVRDLTIDASCSFTYRMNVTLSSDSAKPDGTEHYTGVFMGYGAGPCTFINCRNFASLDLYDLNDGTQVSTYPDYAGKTVGNVRQSISVFGRNNTSAITLINCFNAGALTNHDNGRAVFVEWVARSKENVILNCANVGAMSSAETDEEYSTYYAAFMSCSATAGTAGTYANNYIVGYPVGSSNIVNDGALYGVSLKTGADASGELAYRLNAGYEEYDDVDRVYYTTNGSTEVGTAENQTIAIALDDAGEAVTVYVNLDDATGFDLSNLHEIDTPVYEVDAEDADYVRIEDGIMTVTGVPADYVVNISVYSEGVDLTQLKAKCEELNALPAEEQGWYTSATVSGTLAELLTAVKAKIDATEAGTAGAYTSGKAVSEDLEALGSFTVTGIVPVTAFAKYKAAEGYTVANAKELEYLSTVKDELTAKQTVYFTADIDVTDWTADTYTDVDGDVNSLTDLKASLNGGKAANGKAKITGLKIVTDGTNSGWLGAFTGESVKNLAFENCTSFYNNINYGALLVMSVAASDDYDTATFENLSFKNCTSTSAPADYEGAAGNRRCNMVVGTLNRATNFKDIVIEDCTLMSNTNKGNSAFLAGVAGVVNAENIYLNNNTIAGMTNAVGQGLVLGEVRNTASLKNVAVFNTSYKMSENPEVEGETTNYDQPAAGLIGAYVTTTANASVQNLIMFGNGVADVINCHSTKSATGFGTIKDIYTDAASFSDVEFNYTTENTNLEVAAADFTSGKVAYLMNEADVEQQWAMDGAAPIFASATAKATVAVTFKALDAKLKDAEDPIATYTLYTDKDGKLLGLTEDLLNAASWNGEADLAAAVYENDAEVIGYTTPAHDHQPAYTDNGDGTHDVTCAFFHTDVELNETFTCDYKVEDVPHENVKKNISNVQMTSPSVAHQVVDACKYCDYEADASTAVDCTGTRSVDADRSWDPTCGHGGMTITVCDACDYEFKAIDTPLPHSWGEWTYVDGTGTHKRTCANVADCGVTDEVEDCKFKTWNTTRQPEVGVNGEETSTCVCGNVATRTIPGLTGIIVNPGDAVIGETLAVAIELKSNVATSGLKLAITYNADLLTLTGAKAGTWENVVFDDNFPEASGETTTNFNLVTDSAMSGDGTAVVLEFAVKDDEALENAKTTIAVEVVEAYDENVAPITFKGDSAEVELVATLLKGDLTGDKVVNMADAILLLQYYTEKPQGETEYTINGYKITDKKADLTDEGDGVDLGDGQFAPEVNINDVLHLLRYLNGWTVEL